eukprot:363596-Chlamydomonas_euryale.AAC.11
MDLYMCKRIAKEELNTSTPADGDLAVKRFWFPCRHLPTLPRGTILISKNELLREGAEVHAARDGYVVQVPHYDELTGEQGNVIFTVPPTYDGPKLQLEPYALHEERLAAAIATLMTTDHVPEQRPASVLRKQDCRPEQHDPCCLGLLQQRSRGPTRERLVRVLFNADRSIDTLVTDFNDNLASRSPTPLLHERRSRYARRGSGVQKPPPTGTCKPPAP